METNTPQKKKWYDRVWVVILWLVLFYPVGIYALWRNSTIPVSTLWKAGVTAIMAFLTYMIVTTDSKHTSTEPQESTPTTIETDASEAVVDSVYE